MLPAESQASKTITPKELFARIVEGLQQDTPLMYCNDMVVESARCNMRTTEDEVARRLLTGVIPVSDLFIVYSVYLLGFATPDMVASELNILKKKYPQKIIPAVGVSAVQDRLTECCKSGLLTMQKFKQSVNGRNGSIVFQVYCVGHNGFKLIRQKLGVHVYANDMIAATARVDILKRVASNYVAFSLTSLLDIKEPVLGGGTDNTFKESNLTPYFYAKVSSQDGEKEKIYICEPAYFVVDPTIDDYELRVEKQKSRFEQIERWVECAKAHGNMEVYIIVVCENIEGLNKASAMANEVSPYLAESLYYTSETVLSKLKRNGISDYGFIKIHQENGESSISLAHLD